VKDEHGMKMGTVGGAFIWRALKRRSLYPMHYRKP